MMRIVICVLALAGTLTGCARTDPCAPLAAPTPAELSVAASGAEVEREIAGAECDLVDGRWTAEAEEV